jgi:hypothetical protein
VAVSDAWEATINALEYETKGHHDPSPFCYLSCSPLPVIFFILASLPFSCHCP